MKTVGGKDDVRRVNCTISPYWTAYELDWPDEDDIPIATLAVTDRSYVSTEGGNSYTGYLAGLLSQGRCPLTVDQAEEWLRLYAKHLRESIVLGTRPVLVLQTGLWHPIVPVLNSSPEDTQISAISIYEIQTGSPILVGCIS